MSQINTRPWRVHWFHKWEPVLDAALSSLPAHSQWPNELLRILFEAPSSAPKKVALVLDSGAPVALVGLRLRDSEVYEPLPNYIVPGFLMVGRQELTSTVLATLNIRLRFAWWRMPVSVEPLSQALEMVRSFNVFPTHALCLDQDPEVYWRQSHYWKNVRAARNKTARFQFVVNPPDGLRWTVLNWEKKWRSDPASPMIDLGDRLAASAFLQERRKLLTFGLLDGEQLISGGVCIPDNDDLVEVTIYKRSEYDSYYVGHAVRDRTAYWAKQEGFRQLDYGGGHEYKRELAPVAGEKIEIEICPEPPHRFRPLRTVRHALSKALHSNRFTESGYAWLRRSIRGRLFDSKRES